MDVLNVEPAEKEWRAKQVGHFLTEKIMDINGKGKKKDNFVCSFNSVLYLVQLLVLILLINWFEFIFLILLIFFTIILLCIYS